MTRPTCIKRSCQHSMGGVNDYPSRSHRSSRQRRAVEARGREGWGESDPIPLKVHLNVNLDKNIFCDDEGEDDESEKYYRDCEPRLMQSIPPPPPPPPPPPFSTCYCCGNLKQSPLLFAENKPPVKINVGCEAVVESKDNKVQTDDCRDACEKYFASLVSGGESSNNGDDGVLLKELHSKMASVSEAVEHMQLRLDEQNAFFAVHGGVLKEKLELPQVTPVPPPLRPPACAAAARMDDKKSVNDCVAACKETREDLKRVMNTLAEMQKGLEKQNSMLLEHDSIIRSPVPSYQVNCCQNLKTFAPLPPLPWSGGGGLRDFKYKNFPVIPPLPPRYTSTLAQFKNGDQSAQQ